MSVETVSHEARNAEARDHFGSMYVLTQYVGAWAITWLIPLIARETREWWGFGLFALLLAYFFWRPSFRFLWKHTEWFRLLSVLLALNSLSFFIAGAVTGNDRLAIYPLLVTGGLLILIWPAMSDFARRTGLDDDRINSGP
jgi:hypothetical protein